MKAFNLFKAIALALTFAALAMTNAPAEAAVVKAHAGTTFVLIPMAFDSKENPTLFTHTVDGVVRVSLLGNCTVHFDVIVEAPKSEKDHFSLVGTCRITTADGATTLEAEVVGTGTPDPSNPGLFLNFHYDVKFTGGTGTMANARGKADMDGFAMFTSFTTGKATWLLEGNVATRRRHGHED